MKSAFPERRVPALEGALERRARGGQAPDDNGLLVQGHRRLETQGQISGSGLRLFPGRVDGPRRQPGIRERDAEIRVEGDAGTQRRRRSEDSLESAGQPDVADAEGDLRRARFGRPRLKHAQRGGAPGDEPFGGGSFESVRRPVDEDLPIAQRHSVEAAPRQQQFAVHRETVLAESRGRLEAHPRISLGVQVVERHQVTPQRARVGAAAQPERARRAVPEAHRPVEVQLQELRSEFEPVQVKRIPADAKLRRQGQREPRLFPQANRSRLGADLGIDAAPGGDPESDCHVVHPDVPRRQGIPVADGRRGHRDAVRRERNTTRERPERRSAPPRVGLSRRPFVPSPDAQPLHGEALEMEASQGQKPPAKIAPDLVDREERRARPDIQRIPACLHPPEDELTFRKRDSEPAGRDRTTERLGEPCGSRLQQPVLPEPADGPGGQRDRREQQQGAAGQDSPGAAESGR